MLPAALTPGPPCPAAPCAAYDPYSAAAYYGAGYDYYAAMAAAEQGSTQAAAPAKPLVVQEVPLKSGGGPEPTQEELMRMLKERVPGAAEGQEDGEKQVRAGTGWVGAKALQHRCQAWRATLERMHLFGQHSQSQGVTDVPDMPWLQEEKRAPVVPTLKGAKLAVGPPPPPGSSTDAAPPKSPKPPTPVLPKPPGPALPKPAAAPAATGAPPTSKPGPKPLFLPPTMRWVPCFVLT